VLWIFDRAERYELLGKNPTDGLEHGVFATRSPRRPNPLALSVVELLGRDGATLRVRGVDMLDGSPIVDLKPYLSNLPARRSGAAWLAAAESGEAKRAAASSCTPAARGQARSAVAVGQPAQAEAARWQPDDADRGRVRRSGGEQFEIRSRP
jgi:hypothetical protein